MSTRSSARLSQRIKQNYRSPTKFSFAEDYEEKSKATKITTPRKNKNIATSGNSTPPKLKKNGDACDVTTPEGLKPMQLIDSQNNTPSTLLQRLELNSPRKSAKKLFRDDEQLGNSSKNTNTKDNQKILVIFLKQTYVIEGSQLMLIKLLERPYKVQYQ
nr:unnamed protein product [Callosobruchus analis]